MSKEKIKQDQKELARDLRLQKRLFKAKQRDLSVGYEDEMESFRNLWAKKYEFRHRHIARCLLKGRSYKEIERKTRYGNDPDEKKVNSYIEEYRNRLNIEDAPIFKLKEKKEKATLREKLLRIEREL